MPPKNRISTASSGEEGHGELTSTGARSPGEVASGSRAVELNPGPEAGAGGDRFSDLGLVPKKSKVLADPNLGKPQEEEAEELVKAEEAEELVKAEEAAELVKAAAAAAAAAAENSISAPTSNTPVVTCPPRIPRRRKRKTREDLQLEYNMRTLEDPRDKLPTLCERRDRYTEAALPTPRDKAMARHAGLSVVSVSATGQVMPDIPQCSGILGSWLDQDGTCSTTILTCSRLVTSCGQLCNPMPKLVVLFANETVLEGELLFFNDYYKIALLKMSTEMSSADPFLGSSLNISVPNYGDEVFMLSRGEDGSLMARHGSILRLEKVGLLLSNHCMVTSCDPPMNGTGGPVIDCDGNLKGMAFEFGPAITSIGTICRCTQMWASYSRIARPILGLTLKTVELLDMSLKDKISLGHGISSGYIVHVVSSKSRNENCGITRGDIILSFGRMYVHTLPQLEDFLLDLGLNFLESGRRIDTDVVDLKLPVYDPLIRKRRIITYPLSFSDSSNNPVDWNLIFHGGRRATDGDDV